MTAQIGDIYKHKNKQYTLVALSGKLPFNPKDFGMEPQMSSTACWRGYWCQYAIEDDILTLDELYLCNHDGKFPPINGVTADEEEFEEETVYSKNGEEKCMIPKYHGHRAYKKINLLIPYTGKILVGKDFIQDYYIHMGFQRYWAYKQLIEFVFEDGILVETNDYSELAKNKRKQLKENNTNPRYPENGNIPAFVEDSFSPDYGVKAGFFDFDT